MLIGFLRTAAVFCYCSSVKIVSHLPRSPLLSDVCYTTKKNRKWVSNSHYTTKLYHLTSLEIWNPQPSAQLAQGRIYDAELRTRYRMHDILPVNIRSLSLIPLLVFCAMRKPNRKWYECYCKLKFKTYLIYLCFTFVYASFV